jgi:hypothetical protein
MIRHLFVEQKGITLLNQLGAFEIDPYTCHWVRQLCVECAADHARGGSFRVAQLARLVDLLPGQAEVCDLGNVPVWNNGTVLVATRAAR